jgi:hypothetical protein
MKDFVDLDGDISRRNLLRGLGLSAGGLMLLGTPALLGSTVARGATVARAFSKGPAALEVDGTQSYVISVEGGNAIGTVVSETPVGGAVPGKHIGGVGYEDIVVQLPFTVAPALAAWIGNSLASGTVRKSGAIVYTDGTGSEWKRLEFTDALITGVELPACDASLKNPAYLKLRISPEFARWAAGSGKLAALPPPAKIAVAWQSNFRLNIQGLEPACPYVSKIDAFSWKLSLPASAIVGLREPLKQPYASDVSMLKITVAEANAAPFYAWLDSFLLRGIVNGPDAERGGVLQWLGADMATALATAQFRNLGITRYAPEQYPGAADSISRVEVDMYCEGLGLKLGN